MKKTIYPLMVLLAFAGNNLSAQETLFTENFSYNPGTLPPGWINDAEQPPEWKVNNSQIAGGTANELYLGYGFAVGLSRLTSSPINITGKNALALNYKQYLINFAADAGEQIGLDVTFDNGATWTPLWERPLGYLNIPQDDYTYYVKPTAGATEMKFAFRYEGNNFFINGWAIDDIKVATVVDNDLVARTVSGSSAPNVNAASTYVVTVENGGKLTQTAYTVKLVDENGTTLASVPGQSIGFAETKTFSLSWTPAATDLGIHTLHAVVEGENDQVLTNNATKNLIATVQPAGTEPVQIGTGQRPSADVPYSFFYLNSLSQTLYTAAEINTEPEKITGIQYTVYFDNDLQNVPVQILLGETAQTDLENAWVPPSAFTKVFDGTLNFQKGLNNIFIPFTTPYTYTGTNLVVYTNKSYPEQVLWQGAMNSPNEVVYRSRQVSGDQPFDAMNPVDGYPSYEIPNINLFFSSGALAVIDQDAKNSSVSVYPNPVKDILNITSKENVQEIRIVNAAGQQVLHQKVAESKEPAVNVQKLAPGMYLVQVVTAKGVITKKIIHQ